MTAVATKLWDEFTKLAPDEQWIIRERVISLTDDAHQQEVQARLASDPIRSARGMFAGSKLNESLLAIRAEERRHG